MANLKKTTIYDIATEAGVSASTVAAVMNGSWKKRRITAITAAKVQTVAGRLGYTTNLQARGLRISNSGLVGMIVPMLDNRYFSSLAAAFEAIARSRDLVPAVVSTMRDPDEERNTVEALIAHNVDALFIAGATDPDSISALCDAVQLKHINVDLPGNQGVSVISDNHTGARELTREILSRREASNPRDMVFIGGVKSDHNTQSRIQGFLDELSSFGLSVAPDNIYATGYDADTAETTLRAIYRQAGGLPSGLFVNSTIAFEGVVRFLKTLPVEEIRTCAIGCFDWDPYIELLHFPVVMVAQDAKSMMQEAYRLLDEPIEPGRKIVTIPTRMVLPASIGHVAKKTS